MRRIKISYSTYFIYELEEEEEFQNDGVPWTDAEIKNYFVAQAAEDMVDNALDNREEIFKRYIESMTAEFIQ